MLFNSYLFIFLFLPLVLILFFTAAKFSQKLALSVLLVASIVFYGWWDFKYIIPLMVSIIINYFIANGIQARVDLTAKKHVLWLGILFNLSLLGYYKYTDFFIQNANSLFHTQMPLLNITLPLGISFFTFTQIAFLVDNYRGLVQKTHPLNYALFVTYFPHLIAGPIIHHKEVMPQFEKNRTFKLNYRNFILGMNIFIIGLFKKAVIADYLGNLVSPIFDVHLQHIPTIDAWVASLAYTFELYFDFSGYSDMAIGLSLLIGIKLPVNFYSPYKSVNIIEFWRRWNMTLSRFLRDYLYISLGGNRKGTVQRYLNLMITMVLGGLWHGASWTFVLWGSLHGIYLCINHAWIALKKALSLPSGEGLTARIFSGTLTFMAVVIAWVFFRAPDFATATDILHAMFFQKLVIPESVHLPALATVLLKKVHIEFAAETAWVFSQKAAILIMIASAITWLCPNTYQLFRKYRPAFLPYQYQAISAPKALHWKPKLVWNYVAVSIFVVGIMHIHASSIFLYFRF